MFGPAALQHRGDQEPLVPARIAPTLGPRFRLTRRSVAALRTSSYDANTSARPADHEGDTVLKPDIDYDKCTSHGVCAKTAPDIFEVRDDGTYVIMEEVPDSLREKLQLCVKLCPEAAISFKEG